jgi:MoaA/NifB/PqqE/SkfB family radical SAM enzyme
LATALLTTLAPLTRRRLDRLAGVLDAVAVTLYGAPRTHDRIHGKTGAFRTMAARLAALRATAIPFGFVFTPTDSDLDELTWVKRFALNEGARWLHIRHLEPARSAEDCAARFGERFATRRDLADRSPIRTCRSRRECAAHADHPRTGLADLVEPLVVEADGTAVPLQHGFPRRYALGNLRCARLPVLAARWRSDGGGYAAFRDHCEAALRAAPSQPAFDWLAAVSGGSAPPTTPADQTRTWTL